MTVEDVFDLSSLMEALLDSIQKPEDGRSIIERLVNPNEALIFVGESPARALPIAVAAQRGSLRNLWATSLDLPSVEDIPTIETIVQDSFARAESNKKIARRYRNRKPNFHVERTGIYTVKEAHNKLRRVAKEEMRADPTILDKLFRIELDATDMGSLQRQASTAISYRNIWFQCPWTLRSELPQLLKDSISSACYYQKPYDTFFLGISTHPAYIDAYEIDEVIDHAENLGYLHSTDHIFIQRCIDYGYEHATGHGIYIHDTILDYHQTHIFLKQPPIPSDYQGDQWETDSEEGSEHGSPLPSESESDDSEDMRVRLTTTILR